MTDTKNDARDIIKTFAEDCGYKTECCSDCDRCDTDNCFAVYTSHASGFMKRLELYIKNTGQKDVKNVVGTVRFTTIDGQPIICFPEEDESL